MLHPRRARAPYRTIQAAQLRLAWTHCARKLRARLPAPNPIRGDACNFLHPDLTMKNVSYSNDLFL